MHLLPDGETAQVEALLAQGTFCEAAIATVEIHVDELAVFDLQVDHDASFIAEHFVVHNSSICRFMHGRVFSVERAMQGFREAEEGDDPERIRSAQPWVQTARSETGEEVLFFDRGGRRHVVTRVKGGGFAGGLDGEGLARAGVVAPPLHGLCRSSITSTDE